MVDAGSSLAADWPQWQGPNRDGKSADTGLLKQWPERGATTGLEVDKLGGGDSAPAIAAGRIFGMSNRGDKEVVWALSEKDGSEIWVTPLGPAFRAAAIAGKRGAVVHADGRWRTALCRGAGGQCGLSAGPRRQDRLAAQPDRGFWRPQADVELPRIAAG